ncbi:MAG: glycosyl hydrolase family 28-related protein [Verrucomicrobiales bacterium]|nr:glycosyl hydrolase family 28-related protein [Verrucomicrobiales bacterium]
MRTNLFIILALAAHSSWAANVRDYGAVGDGITDDTSAIKNAFQSEREIHFPAGVYLISDGLELPHSVTITGEGSPSLGTFPLKDDKTYLDKDRFSKLPGTTLLFRNRGTKALKTTRSDQFSSLRYALKTATDSPWKISHLAILLDMQVTSGGKKTSAKADMRSDYDVGLLVDDSPGGTMHSVSIYGYWNKAGLCIVTRGAGSNPDYNTFWNSSFSGDYGVALIGNDELDGPGLSGTQFFGCNLFSNDHHLRSSAQWGKGSLFIDGKTAGTRADLNGHYFFGGCIRTYNNIAVRLNHASNLSFHGTVFEVPAWEGENSEGADMTGRIIGTENTRDIMFFGCRMHDIGIHQLAESMTGGSVTLAGDLSKGIFIQSGSRLARLSTHASGDPILQLSNGSTSINNGWTLRHDTSEDDELDIRFNNKPTATLRGDGSLTVAQLNAGKWKLDRSRTEIIVDSSIPVSRGRMKIKAKPEDKLETLRGGSEGELILIEMAPGSVPFPAGTSKAGNIRLPSPFTFDHHHDRLTLIHIDGDWVETARTDFPAESKKDSLSGDKQLPPSQVTD